MNPVLILSSLSFLSNVAAALHKEEYKYAACFYFLTVTSILQHGLQGYYTKVLDDLAIVGVVSYGSYFFYKKQKSYMTITVVSTLFLSTVVLYNIGKITDGFCFHPDLKISNFWHVLMHLFASLGHHIILLA